MPRLGRFARELRARLWKPSIEEEVRRELEHHLELLEQDLVAQGVDPAAARGAARTRFGDVERISETCRNIGRRRDKEMRRSEWLGELGQDMRYALRQMRSNPRFTLIAMLTLAVGLGATTTIFGIASAVLLRPLPIPDSERLVRLMATSPAGQPFAVSEPDYIDWRTHVRGVANIAAFAPRTPIVREDAGAQQLIGAAVTHTLFATLGVPPVLGRAFSAGEDMLDGDRRVAVVAHALWHQHFGGDPQILSRTIELDGSRHRIIGVMPRGFDFPGQAQVWVPLAPSAAYHRGDRRLDVVARLASGVTSAQAGSELASLARQLAIEYPASNTGWGTMVRPFSEWYVTPQLEARVVALLVAVGLLLVMACANVSGLLLARASAREREMAVRSALGAGRARILRQLLCESVLLAVLGAGIGIAVAAGTIPLIRAVGADAVPRLQQLALDWRVLTFALGACLTTGVLFGLAPALHLAPGGVGRRVGISGVLRSGSRTIGGGRLRGMFVVTSVGLATLVLVTAGLVGGSFAKLMRVQLGFSPEHVLTGSVVVPTSKEGGAEYVASFYAELTQRLAAIAGVREAGAISIAPFSGGNTAMEFAAAHGGPTREGEYRLASWRVATAGVFAALDIPLVRGRLFNAGDHSGTADVIVINETMARLGWPGIDPVGRQARLESGRTAIVVGIVGDTRHLSADSLPPPTMYFAHAQFPRRSMWITVRSAGDPSALVGAVRRELTTMDPDVPLSRLQPLTTLVRERAAEPRLTTLVLAIFATAAVVLAAIGLYGVVAYTVSQRSREIGVRLALGAAPHRIMTAVVARGVQFALIGVALGGVAAYAAAGALRAILFETDPTNPVTFVSIGALLLVVAVVASAAPARRASRVSPMLAMRSE